MPSSQTFRMPVWLPLALIAVSVVVILFCVMHMQKRMKAKWPW